MRLDLRRDGIVVVTLSRRNVLTLLAKLEQPLSARAIVMRGAFIEGVLDEDVVFAVRVETDDVHYADRLPPGEMSPETERFIASPPPADEVVQAEQSANGDAKCTADVEVSDAIRRRS